MSHRTGPATTLVSTAAVMAYVGRSGWNTLRIGGAIPDDELDEMKLNHPCG